MNLLIVESPVKARTIASFLPEGWTVIPTGGHVRDLPRGESMGVYRSGGSILFDFQPIAAKSRYMDRIRATAGSASRICIATDPDREGEAIAWHVSKMMGGRSCERVSFNAVVKSAVQRALEHPRQINTALVDAYLARRAIDRVIGYKLSPIASARLRTGENEPPYSVGRVQCGALGQVRKGTVAQVRSGHYIVRTLYRNGFQARLKERFTSKEQAGKAMRHVSGNANHYVKSGNVSQRVSSAPPPLTTGGLIKSACRLFDWDGAKTMGVAQRLYETGRITYPRTDSVLVAPEGMELARDFIFSNFGAEFTAENAFTSSVFAQEAHECIRPTELTSFSHENDECRLLYEIIRGRFVASQMPPAIFKDYEYEIFGTGRELEASATRLLFPGHLRSVADPDELAHLEKGQVVDVPQVVLLTKASVEKLPPDETSVFDEAALVEDMEKLGIGRPSTYASTVSMLLKRGYVRRKSKEEKNAFEVTGRGDRLLDWLGRTYPFIGDPSFSGEIERDLDEIAAGRLRRDELIRCVWERLDRAVETNAPEPPPLEWFLAKEHTGHAPWGDLPEWCQTKIDSKTSGSALLGT